MYGFESACTKALKYLKKKNDDIGLAEIGDLPDRWIFFGYGGGPFGSVPVTINKEDGSIATFPMALVENQDLYYDFSEPIEVPEKFR